MTLTIQSEADRAVGLVDRARLAQERWAADVVVDRKGRRGTFAPARRGVLEIRGDERAFAVPLQPYPD